ncbi:integral membrane protein [Streptomyces davaonensis JCM 4913]|uniref:Integral membrane protein n=1 Tax=Streptomyces davaonensis (strain DSM 101723 / JCM 4913 / KCC S-0913 / 768) TaxID=1214101 RepID=K4QWC1_STRDJ|nr:acyltransferase family protein [Streptomyces davaonensis]CCK25145.1 integral membrane protein [Streptomyces davaonensis JCM 4913]
MRSLGQAQAPPGANDGTAAAPAGRTARSVKERDAFFDNAKYLAIVLVAMGHAWEPLRDESRTVTALYMVVYAFHMPAFIVISGYFSRTFDATPGRVKRLVTGVAVPYVVFEVAYTFFTRWTDNEPGRDISLLDPLYLTWFLAALFIWRLTTPIWRIARWPLPVALGIASLATLTPTIGKDLDLQRALQFLPYFVLGLILKPEHFALVRRREVRLAAVPVLLGAAVVAYWAVPRMNYAWFFHRTSAEDLAAPAWYGPLMTLVLFGCSMILVACFLSLVPGRGTWFTALGAGTLYGYLLHGFVIQAANKYHWSHLDWVQEPLGKIVVTLVAGAMVTALCTAPVRRVFRFAMEPKMEWAFRRDPVAEARSR